MDRTTTYQAIKAELQKTVTAIYATMNINPDELSIDASITTEVLMTKLAGVIITNVIERA